MSSSTPDRELTRRAATAPAISRRSSISSPTNANGFTILELVIVLIFMSLLMLIATPKIISQRYAAQRRMAIRQFVSTHSLTLATAVRYGRTAELHVDAPGRRFWLEVDTGQTSGITDTVRMISLTADLTMSTDRTILCFDARGLATTAGSCEPGNALVTFAEPGKTDTVRFSALGEELR